MLVAEFLEASAYKTPDKVCLVCDNKRFTYGEIETAANKLANALVAQNVRRGDRVGIYLTNSAELVIAIFGVLKAGATFLVINRTVKFGKLAYILTNCQAKAIITDAEAFESLSAQRDQVASLQVAIITNIPEGEDYALRYVILEQIMGDESDAAPDSRCIDMDLAALIYTSGSTGFPKGVMLTHLNMIAAANSITQYLENNCDDIILNVLPLSFDYGLYQVLMAFKIGGTLILEKSFSYPYPIIEKLISEKVTGFPIVPTIAAMITQLKNLERYNFEHLRYISNTAAHLPRAHIDKLRTIFPKAKIYCMYGLTECKRVSYLPPDKLDEKPDSVGKGMPNEDVYIVNEGGEDVAPGEIGELVVRGSNVMQGYWGMPEETARVLRRGRNPWEKVLYTGDLFKKDADAYLYFIGRKDDIIKSRGEKVSPLEIENVIHRMPGVAEVSITGVKHEIFGEAIKAIVVRDSDGAILTAEAIKDYCSKNLEDFMVPQIIEFQSLLLKTDSGKVRRGKPEKKFNNAKKNI
ncbi:AMP-binding protein [candidate division KSB1 bacterium]|nr:AMP-binding protein [candidate division KSB1 bacterium]